MIYLLLFMTLCFSLLHRSRVFHYIIAVMQQVAANVKAGKLLSQLVLLLEKKFGVSIQKSNLRVANYSCPVLGRRHES